MVLKYLETFNAIVEEGSFQKAAARLHYSQSTITFQMGQLEQELSTSLFEKIGRKMVLTKAGEQLKPYIENVLESVLQMRNVHYGLTSCTGDLQIGVAETQLCYRLAGMLKTFHQLAPKVRLFLKSMNCYDIRDALVNGTLDIGVFYEDVGGLGSSLTRYPIGEFPLVLVASPAVQAKYPDFVTPDQSIPLPLIINEANCIYRQFFEAYLKARSIRLDHTIELWSIPTIKNLVMCDVGVTFLPKFTVQNELDQGTLVEIPIAERGMQITAVCAHHKNKWLSPAMDKVEYFAHI